MAATPTAQAAASYQSDQLAATTFKRLHPSAYLARFFDSGVREDARSLLAFRPATLSLGSISTADGSAFVRMGNTACIAAVKAEIATPHLSRPDEGYLIPNVELPAACSARIRPGPPSDEAQTLTERVLTLLNTSRILPLSQLCIQQGQSAWCLYLDISFLSFDGNPIDAALFAAVAALRNTTLPQATFDQETGQTTARSDKRSPLLLSSIPLCASFGTFQAKHLVSDPSAFEASLLSSTLTVAIQAPSSTSSSSSNEKLSFLYHAGSLATVDPESKSNANLTSSDQQTLDKCIALASQRCAQLRKQLHEAEASIASA